MAPQSKNNKRKRRADTALDDEEYRRKRDKNNLAVKRSRDKTKEKTKQTLDRVVQLKSENETLEEKIKMLTKELSFLRNLFLAHAGSSNGVDLSGINLSALLQEDPEASAAAIRDLINNPDFKVNKNARQRKGIVGRPGAEDFGFEGPDAEEQEEETPTPQKVCDNLTDCSSPAVSSTDRPSRK